MKGQYLKIDKVGFKIESEPMVLRTGEEKYEVVVLAKRLTNNVTKVINVESVEIFAEVAHMGDYR